MPELQKTSDREGWDEFVLDQNGHPLQLWGWGQLKTAHGWHADRVFLYDDEHRPLMAAQILTRRLPYPFRAFSYIPRGPIGDNAHLNDFLTEATTFVAREYHSVALSIEPETLTGDLPKGWRKGANSILPAETIRLDLSQPESQLLADMAKKTRQYIRKSAAEPVEIRRIRTAEQLKPLLDIYHQTAQRASFQLHDDQYYYDVFTSLADNNVVFASYQNDQPIAFLWLAISEAVAFELYGGMNEVGQELRANYALKWHAIRKMKEWGINTYDFGGLVQGGVSTFKQSWSGEETVLAGTFDRPLSAFYSLWTRWLPTAKRTIRSLKKLRNRRV